MVKEQVLVDEGKSDDDKDDFGDFGDFDEAPATQTEVKENKKSD